MFLFFCSRAVTDSINQLITLCTQQAPGQKECDNALRELEVKQKKQKNTSLITKKKTDFSKRCDEIRILVSDSSCSVCTQM